MQSAFISSKSPKNSSCNPKSSSSTVTHLQRHMKVKHGITFKCTECEKVFDNNNNLKSHVKQHIFKKLV